MLTRREVLRLGVASGLASLVWPAGCEAPPSATQAEGLLVNDMHAQLNATRVAQLRRPDTPAALARLLCRAHRQGQHISLTGARHAMGGQQFGSGTWLLRPRLATGEGIIFMT
ncbi:MAG: hypothetical protein ACOC9P_00620 [bacterium]